MSQFGIVNSNALYDVNWIPTEEHDESSRDSCSKG